MAGYFTKENLIQFTNTTTMSYLVQLLNYDSEWVTYCDSPNQWYAGIAAIDLQNHGFQPHQIRIKEE